MNTRHLFCALLMLWLAPAFAAPAFEDHVEAALIAERNALVPGEDNWLALRLQPDPGWHVYWLNPGDSGIATSLQWSLPANVEAGPLHWPHPQIHRLGELVNYGYGEETLHLVPLRLGAGWREGQVVALQAQAKWLVCRDICIPGSATLTLDLPVRAKAQLDTAWRGAFAEARARLPTAASGWSARYAISADSFTLAVEGSGFAGQRLEFFPEANDLVNHAAPQRLAVDERGLRLSQALSSYFVNAPELLRGVLVAYEQGTAHAYQIVAEGGRVEAVAEDKKPAAVAPAGTTTAAAAPPPSLLLALLSALFGGLILNLMPCVFPVLSLKALALMEARGLEAAHARRGALAYTAGVILSFMAVAGVLLALREAGRAVGWGFQLQSPLFIGLLAYLLFGLGLSLSGVAQFGTRWMGMGQALTEQPGLRGSFFTGILAVVVASPCTVPFMGTAVGYAVSRSAGMAMLVFATLGLGLALPFLLIGFFPRLGAWLPKPGAWMETFKQAMAFPLYLTVVWLVWVLARQADAQAAGVVLLGLVLIAFALWLWNRAGLLATALRLSALMAAALLLVSGAMSPQPLAVVTAEVAANAWSEARVEALRAEGRTIFVDFTADWCLTCKVNERVALKSDAVQRAFREHKVVFLKADWTRNDPAITQALARFNRPGVPLYVVYRAGGEPRLLPQLLTPDLVIDAITPSP